MEVGDTPQKSRPPRAARHSEKSSEKTCFGTILQQKYSQSTKDSCVFCFVLPPNPILFRCVAVLKQQLFQLTNKKIPGILGVFREFFMKLSGKGAVQNRFLTMVRRPYFHYINSSLRGLRNMPWDGCRWGTGRERLRRRPDDRSCGIPKP